MMKRCVLICLLCINTAAVFCRGRQSSSAPVPEFEVSSVKPSAGQELNGIYTFPGGRVVCRGCTLQFLMEQAFSIQEFQLVGGPAWIDGDRYDIDAKVPADAASSNSAPPHRKAPPNAEQRRMLQSLLVKRFQLRYRQMRKEAPLYLLVRGKGPLKLKEPKDKAANPWAGSPHGGRVTGDGLSGVNESMADLAWRLSSYLGRPVLKPRTSR